MSSFWTKNKIPAGVIGGILFFADRLFKWLAIHNYFPYFKNEGLLFSIPWPASLIVAISGLVILAVVWLFIRTKQIPLLFILLGGLSNIFDRIRYGAVIDYIFLPSSAPANISDWLILSGLVLLAWNYWRSKATPPPQKISGA